LPGYRQSQRRIIDGHDSEPYSDVARCLPGNLCGVVCGWWRFGLLDDEAGQLGVPDHLRLLLD
jgi:hypothetical protein